MYSCMHEMHIILYTHNLLGNDVVHNMFVYRKGKFYCICARLLFCASEILYTLLFMYVLYMYLSNIRGVSTRFKAKELAHGARV